MGSWAAAALTSVYGMSVFADLIAEHLVLKTIFSYSLCQGSLRSHFRVCLYPECGLARSPSQRQHITAKTASGRSIYALPATGAGKGRDAGSDPRDSLRRLGQRR